MSHDSAIDHAPLAHPADGPLGATDRAAQALHRAADGVAAYAHRNADSWREGATDLQARARDSLQDATDSAATYIRQEPAKSLLVAVAAGALLMVLFSLLTRSRARG